MKTINFGKVMREIFRYFSEKSNVNLHIDNYLFKKPENIKF